MRTSLRQIANEAGLSKTVRLSSKWEFSALASYQALSSQLSSKWACSALTACQASSTFCSVESHSFRRRYHPHLHRALGHRRFAPTFCIPILRMKRVHHYRCQLSRNLQATDVRNWGATTWLDWDLVLSLHMLSSRRSTGTNIVCIEMHR